MLSPYQFYQSLFKTADADVGRFLRMLTFLPLEEVAALEASMQVRRRAIGAAHCLASQAHA